MRILCDTTILVDVDRGRTPTVNLLSRLINSDAELFISTITVSEILTGAYLQSEKAIFQAKELLSQFHWISLDAETADQTARLTATRIRQGRPVSFQDTAILATLKTCRANFLLTTNKKDFDLALFKDNVMTPQEFLEKANRLQVGWRLK